MLQVTFAKHAAGALHAQLQAGRAYLIKGGYLRNTNAEYNATNCNKEIYIAVAAGTTIEPVETTDYPEELGGVADNKLPPLTRIPEVRPLVCCNFVGAVVSEREFLGPSGTALQITATDDSGMSIPIVFWHPVSQRVLAVLRMHKETTCDSNANRVVFMATDLLPK